MPWSGQRAGTGPWGTLPSVLMPMLPASVMAAQGLSGLLGLPPLKPITVVEKRSWTQGQQTLSGSRTIKQLGNKAALAHITVLPRGRSCYTPDS